MREQFKVFEKRIRSVIEHATQCKYWALRELPPLRTWVGGRGHAIIIGDAAHAMLPTTGQVSPNTYLALPVLNLLYME